ncbi:MAG: exodeoxyribonuclease III [Spirochaetota bacterium]|nr:exodeoxyribonuclease III [Spirochaetota bacterium]
MKIISWNVNGIRAVAKKGFSDWLRKSGADIICLQETKAFFSQVENDLKCPEGYNSYWHNGKVPGYAGVVTYSKQKPININTSFDTELEVFKNDGRVVEIEFSSFILLNIYFPNGSPRSDGTEMLSHKLKFYEVFLNYINKLRSNGKKIIILGDYNIAHTEIDIARPKENENSIGFLPIERAWITKIIDNGYIDVFRHFNPNIRDVYSWWSYRTKARERNIGWRLDYIFITPDLLNNTKSIGYQTEITGSDHCPVFIELNFD